uniref:Delta-like protein C n=1 Tax=Heterorhabditis bacteriophora TaxID=37862 RepID=A0A1I7XG13_HETBA
MITNANVNTDFLEELAIKKTTVLSTLVHKEEGTSPATLKSKSSLTYELSRSTASNMTFIELSIRTHSDSGHILTVYWAIEKRIRTVEEDRISLIRRFPASITLPALIPSTLLRIGSTSFNDSFDGCIQDVKISTLCLSSPQCGLLSPCLNKAKCVDLWNKYRCECLPGFAGDHCEINVDECRSTDCGQGYCINKVNEARCLCDVGFTGEACDAAIDQCDHLPCKNGGLCENSNGTFNCECKKGWMGKTCEIKALSNCDDSPCKNGGKCEINEV